MASFIIICHFLVPAIIFYMFSLKEAVELGKTIVNEDFIRSGINIKDIVSDDLFLTAWDLNDRNPRFFNQWSAINEGQEGFNQNLTVGEMTWASANTPKYFKPVSIKGDDYISGDNIASNPALFAYMYANERKGETDIRVVSIGSINTEADIIKSNAGLLTWATRMASLNQPAKKHTQDYMLEAILRKNGGSSHVIQLQKSGKVVHDLEKSWSRGEDLQRLSA